MICHSFLQEGGGSGFDQLVIVLVCHYWLRREGVRAKMHDVILFTVFSCEGAALEVLIYVRLSVLPSVRLSPI